MPHENTGRTIRARGSGAIGEMLGLDMDEATKLLNEALARMSEPMMKAFHAQEMADLAAIRIWCQNDAIAFEAVSLPDFYDQPSSK